MRRFVRRLQKLNNWQIFYILVAITIGTAILSILINPDKLNPGWISSWLQNFSSEMMGAMLTFWLFDLIVRVRNEKQSMIVELRSTDAEPARKIVNQFRENRWLLDGSLHNVNLLGANLESVDLKNADLKGVYLNNAILKNADLKFADFKFASFRGANLENAELHNADLHNADLRHANLTDAKLYGTDLTKANLEGAILDQAKWEAVIDGVALTAILPDGRPWEKTSNLKQFTHPERK